MRVDRPHRPCACACAEIIFFVDALLAGTTTTSCTCRRPARPSMHCTTHVACARAARRSLRPPPPAARRLLARPIPHPMLDALLCCSFIFCLMFANNCSTCIVFAFICFVMAAVAASAAAAAATTTTSSTSSSSSSSISTITFNAFTPKARQLAQQRGQLEDFICLQNNVAMLSEPVHGLLNAIYEFVHKMQVSFLLVSTCIL